jgi:hypothetical protein
VILIEHVRLMLYLVQAIVLDIISQLLVVLIRLTIHVHVTVILQLVHVLVIVILSQRLYLVPVIVTLRVRH